MISLQSCWRSARCAGVWPVNWSNWSNWSWSSVVPSMVGSSKADRPGTADCVTAGLFQSYYPDGRDSNGAGQCSATHGLGQLRLRHGRATFDALLPGFGIQLIAGSTTFAAVGAESAPTPGGNVVSGR